MDTWILLGLQLLFADLVVVQIDGVTGEAQFDATTAGYVDMQSVYTGDPDDIWYFLSDLQTATPVVTFDWPQSPSDRTSVGTLAFDIGAGQDWTLTLQNVTAGFDDDGRIAFYVHSNHITVATDGDAVSGLSEPAQEIPIVTLFAAGGPSPYGLLSCAQEDAVALDPVCIDRIMLPACDSVCE